MNPPRFKKGTLVEYYDPNTIYDPTEQNKIRFTVCEVRHEPEHANLSNWWYIIQKSEREIYPNLKDILSIGESHLIISAHDNDIEEFL